MGLNKLIFACSLVAALVVSNGNLPKVLHFVRLAQLTLIKESGSSNWGQVMLLPMR